MSYWLETSETIEKGVGFQHFDATHLAWLAVFVLFSALVSLLYRRADAARRVVIRRVMAACIVADELFKMAALWIGGNFDVSYLPLHLCSINIFLVAFHASKPNATLDNFLYAICIPGALLALLFPTWTRLPVQNFMHLHSFTVHILLAAYPIMLTIGGDIQPRARFIPRVVGLLLLLASVALVFNLMFDTNFMFLMSASKGNPLYWFKRNLGSHLWGFPILLPLVLLAMYAPFLRHRKNEKLANA